MLIQQATTVPARTGSAGRELVWLRALAEAVRDHGGRALTRESSFAEVLNDLAGAMHQQLARRGDAAQQRAWLQEVAVIPAAEMRRAAEQMTAAVAGKLPSILRSQLTVYLAQAAAAIRQALRRPYDPEGVRVPGDLPLESAKDFVPLLPARPALYRPGDQPGGLEQWRLVDLLALSEVGEVWKAQPVRRQGPPVVLKFWPEKLARNPLFHRDATRVIKALQEKPMAGVVRLEELHIDRNPVCLTMELVEGGTLAGLMQKWGRTRLPAQIEQTGRVMLSLAQVLAWGHGLPQPLVHGDLKPAHLLLQQIDGGPVLLRVADYGLGLAAMRNALTQARQGIPAGLARMQAYRGSYSRLYASTALRAGAEPGPADDVYAVGVIAYQMLLANPAAELAPDWQERLDRLCVPPRLTRLLEACLAEEPGRRIDSGALLAELTSALAPRVVATVQARTGPKDPRAERVRQALVRVQRLHALAREMQARHEYITAIDILETVPQRLRDAALYQSLCQCRDRVHQLDRDITAALRARAYQGLRPKVEELLQLKPMRSELRQLLDDWPVEGGNAP